MELLAGSHGHFEVKCFKYIVIHNILQSIEIMSDSANIAHNKEN